MLDDTYFLQDNYKNIYFSISDTTGSVKCFFYSTDSINTMQICNKLKNAVKEKKDVRIYGIYQENPKQVGKYSLFVYDIDFADSQANTKNNDKSQVINKDNIKNYKPTGLRIYKDVYRDLYGKEITTTFKVIWDKVEGGDNVVLYVRHDLNKDKGFTKMHKVSSNTNSYEFVGMRNLDMYIVVYKDGISSLPSEIVSSKHK